MSGMSNDDTIAELRAQVRRQREALEQIVERCDAVNYPPDLVVDMGTLARRGLGRLTRRRGAVHEGPQGEARA